MSGTASRSRFVGTDRLARSGGCFRAKSAQERLIKDSSIPYSIVHATLRLDHLVRRRLRADPSAGYAGHGAGCPDDYARLAETRFEDWLSQPANAA